MSFRSLFLVFLAALVALPVWGETPPLEQRVVEHRLANGISLLILERHFSPTVSIRMLFRTGSVDEISGKTGLAHMFEHMMFKGTRTLGTKDYSKEEPLLRRLNDLHRALDLEQAKGEKSDQNKVSALLDQIRDLDAKEAAFISENELWNLYERQGASNLNATTSRDFTQYIVDLPSNKLELWAILDSDRVRNPIFRQFYQEREVVKEERRMRVDNSPDGNVFERFLATAYEAHPYRNPTIGWESDLDHLNVEDLESFYRRFYTPDRLTIAVVGDVKAEQVIALVEKYFASWRPTAAPALSTITDEPASSGPRRITVRMPAQPQLLVGFHVPTYPNPDHVTSFALSQLLGSGTTSRLYKSIVEKKKLATSIETEDGYPGQRYGTLLIIAASPRFPHTASEVEGAIWKEIERLKTEPIQPWELEKMRAAIDVDLLNTLQTNAGMAGTLAYDHAIFGDWRYLLKFQERVKGLTAAELQQAARKYLVSENSTTAVLESIKK